MGLYQAAGRPAIFAASGGSSFVSQSLPMNRQPVTPSDARDINHCTGATITPGLIRPARSGTSADGIIRVSAGPPGSRAFTVTPVEARSFAQITVAASSAALDGP